MLKRVVRKFGLLEHTDRKPRRRKNQLKASPEFSLQSQNISVKIIHEGGQKELYQHAVPASKLMEKYPGMCIALPEVFKDPHQSVLWPEEFLLPGHKYIIISCKAVEKLKRKYPSGQEVKENGKMEVPIVHEIFEAKTTPSPRKTEEEDEDREENRVSVEESICCAKDFYGSKDKWEIRPKRKGIKGKKPFVPPLPKEKSFRNLVWQPSLSTVEELSS